MSHFVLVSDRRQNRWIGPTQSHSGEDHTQTQGNKENKNERYMQSVFHFWSIMYKIQTFKDSRNSTHLLYI